MAEQMTLNEMIRTAWDFDALLERAERDIRGPWAFVHPSVLEDTDG